MQNYNPFMLHRKIQLLYGQLEALLCGWGSCLYEEVEPDKPLHCFSSTGGVHKTVAADWVGRRCECNTHSG